MTNYQKIQDGRHIEYLIIFYYKWRPFCFFWQFWFFSCYLPFLLTTHPQKHTIRYITYWFCPFILDIVAYSHFGVEIFSHLGFMLIWDISPLNRIYFKSVLHWEGPYELQYTSVVLLHKKTDTIANEIRIYLMFLTNFLP